MTEFFAMNGYGFYVWSAYGAAALAVALEIAALRMRRRAVLAEARGVAPEAVPASGASE